VEVNVRKFVFPGIAALVIISVLFVGCSSQATPAPANPAPANPAPAPAPGESATVTGKITAVNTAADAGPDTITIETAHGTQTFGINPDTEFSLDGKACNLIDLGTTVQQGGATYNCTAVYDEAYGVLDITVWQASQ
jgi:hypothetical protein